MSSSPLLVAHAGENLVIDYFSHIAVFEGLRKKLAGVNDPQLVSSSNELLSDAADYPEAALLGTLVDHLLMHTESTAFELEILSSAADLWKRGLLLYDIVGGIRKDVETALSDPTTPTAQASFNSANARLIGLRPMLADIKADLDSVGVDVTYWRHLKDPHPRQVEMPIIQWRWGDRFLARRTDAFVRAAFKNAKDSDQRAFALGALASYGGNVSGSAFLWQVVGGPRRLHPRRDRVARNAVGAWLRVHRALPSLSELGSSLQRNSNALQPEELRNDLERFIQKCLKDAFPAMQRPNLSNGFVRLQNHIQLLQVFVRPPKPSLPSPQLMSTMSALGDEEFNIMPSGQEDVPYGPPPPPGPDPTPTLPSQRPDSEVNQGDTCLVGLAIVTVLYFIISGIVALAQGKEWHPFDDLANSNTGSPSEEEVSTTAAQLNALPSTPNGMLIVNEYFSFQMLIWQLMEECLTTLVKKGLVYPDASTIDGENFSQFTATGLVTPLPFRTENALDEGYMALPSGSIEHPSTASKSLPSGATPISFVDASPAPSSFLSADEEAMRLWLQIARSESDTFNYDLDADRGYRAPCWQVAARTSITDDPVVVEELPYTNL